MITQSGNRATPRLDLGAALMEYFDNAQDFIGLRVYPMFESKEKAAYFPAITRESIARRAEVKRAANGKYNRDGYETRDLQFSCYEYGLEAPVDDAKKSLYKSDFDAELVATQIIGRRLQLEHEIRVKTSVIDTATFTGADLYKDNAAAPWTTAGSDVRSQVNEAKEKIRVNSGLSPNSMIMSQGNLDALKSNTAILDAIKYTARLTDAEIVNALADYFGIQNILIGKATYNSAKEGKAFAGGYVWPDTYVSLAILSGDTSKSLTDPALGRTVLWTADSPEANLVETYRDESVRGDVVRVRQNVDELLIDKYFGFLMKVR